MRPLVERASLQDGCGRDSGAILPSVPRAAASEGEAREYRVYVESILRPLRPEAVARLKAGEGRLGSRLGRAVLEEALSSFLWQLKGFVTGCDDRKLSKAALRRARGIESQLGVVTQRLLAALLKGGNLEADDLHGIWYGFAAVRGWRDSRVPQECLLQMLRGALAELDEHEVERWTGQALTWELTLPEVHQAISVSAWPSLCELLGRLPDCVTPAELQEALWQQSFVENPTHAPDHRNYRRFAVLAAQMVAIGVELESDKVELLVQQTLDLDRPWRERRDMLSGILSAASVEDRQLVVRNLDRRFEEHADIDDFEIVCGIAEHIGIEVPRDGAIRRCALRRWALDPKRGGLLPVARLIDFVDMDASIGEDVAMSLRQKGRVADAALLLSRLPRHTGCAVPGDSVGTLDVNNGDAELARLRELLSLDDDLASNSNGAHGGKVVFGPIEEGGAFKLPLDYPDQVRYAETAKEACQAAARLSSAPILTVGIWREEAPFWHSPATLLALGTEERLELFDLPALRRDESGDWPDAADRVRALLSNQHALKVVYGDDTLHVFAFALGLGVAGTLKHADKEPLGPFLDSRGLMADVLGCAAEDPECAWPALARRFLGVRLCPEEAGSNWARRPLRESQLHHAATEAWTQLPLLRAACSYGIVSPALARRHLTVQAKVRPALARKLGGKGHVVGQLAPPGRLAWTEPGHAPIVNGIKGFVNPHEAAQPAAQLIAPTRIAVLTASHGHSDGPDGCALHVGTLVEVLEERFGGLASVLLLGCSRSIQVQRVPVGKLEATNGWECPSWVASLPRPRASILQAAEGEDGSAGGRAHGGAASTSTSTASRAARTAVTQAADSATLIARKLLDELFNLTAAKEILQWMYKAQRRADRG